MDISNGWYLASFFLTAGGTMSVSAEGKQVLTGFDSDAAISAMQVANKIAKDDGFVTGDDSVLTGAFGHDASKGQDIGCAVTGIWNKTALEKAVGGAENLGFMKLPTIKVLGEDKQMISFGGYKAIGVNKTSKNPAEAMKFAQFITNYDNQVKRYNDHGFAPSNKQAAAHASVLADPAIAALSMQMGYTYPQNNVVSSFWTPAEAVGLELEKKTVEDSSLPELIADMITKIQS
jgi:arabinogalactan oligomer/maltooligosaccharide transport system substrate-binding protein